MRTSLQFPILDEQPLLEALLCYPVLNNSICLYTFERYLLKLIFRTKISLKLINTGNCLINFANITFKEESDTYTHEPDVHEVYDRDVFLHSFSLMSIEKTNNDILLYPGETKTFELDCFGKHGCTKVNIKIDYGNKQLDKDYYSRQTEIETIVNVYPCIQLLHFDILPNKKSVSTIFKKDVYFDSCKDVEFVNYKFGLMTLDLINNSHLSVEYKFTVKFGILFVILDLDSYLIFKRVIKPKQTRM